jgi:hypothetical protein
MRPIVYQTPDSIRARCIAEGNCLLWQGGNDGKNRPQCRHGGETVYVRRLMRGLVDGKDVPVGMSVACTCGNKLCVSDLCSTIVTDKGRARLAAARGAFSRRDKIIRTTMGIRARSKISEALVIEIRCSDGSCREIAERTGVSLSHVKSIRRGSARAPLSSPFAGLGAR